jgi:hypothetical protein
MTSKRKLPKTGREKKEPIDIARIRFQQRQKKNCRERSFKNLGVLLLLDIRGGVDGLLLGIVFEFLS